MTALREIAPIRVGHAGRHRDEWNGEQVRETRRQILDATQRLLLRKGSASIRDIEAESGLARGTLYRHFESRDHIVAVLQLRWIDHLERTFKCKSADPLVRLHAVVDATTKCIRFDPVIARAALEARQTNSAGVFDACDELDRRVTTFLRAVVLKNNDVGERLDGPFRLVWYGALTQWAQALLSIEELELELKDAANLLVAGLGCTPRRGDTLDAALAR